MQVCAVAGILPRGRLRTTHSDKRSPQGGELGAFPRHTSGASYRVREESHGVQEPSTSHPTSAGPPTSASPCRITSRLRGATAAARAPLRRSPTSRRLVRYSNYLALQAPLRRLLSALRCCPCPGYRSGLRRPEHRQGCYRFRCVQCRHRSICAHPRPPSARCLAEDDSPYPEVRSAVANTDDPSMPASSLRVWVIGLIWAMIIPGMNQFFFFRFPAVNVTGVRSRRPCSRKGSL